MTRTLLAVVAFATAVSAAASPSSVADAAMRRDAAAVRALVKQGGDVNAAQGDGMTALHWAAMNADADLATTLLSAGANVRATTRLGGYTPLHLASQNGATTVIEALIGAGAATNTPTATGASALMLAAAGGHVEAVKALLDRQADVGAVENANGQSALMFAAALDRAEVVKLLLSRGASSSLTSRVFDLAGVVAPEDALQTEIRDRQNAE